ncbi:MAG: PAS domain S-box protein [Oscillatoriaceae cyanobacterium Prado104]|nr:PAS domain S-box protein [Oscillatoriaceae cyanobacterium Prado104]
MNKQVIICVDDEQTVLRSLKAELRGLIGGDCTIEVAESAQEALEIIEEVLGMGYEVPIVISDYVMPNMKGDELLKQVHLISPKTVKVMLSGQATVEGVSNAVNYGDLYRYMAKPWRREDLQTTVTEAILSYVQDKQLAEKNTKIQEMNRELERLNREQTELIATLHEKESRLTQFLEAMPVGVSILNAAGEVYYTNQKAQELLGTGVVANTSAAQLSEVYQIYKSGTNCKYPVAELPVIRALNGERVTADDVEIHRAGKVTPLENWATPIYDGDGNISYAIVAFNDITKRRQAEDALLQAEQKYRSIFENAFEGIFQTALDGSFISVNQALAQIYGYDSPEDLIANMTNIQGQLYVDPMRRTEFIELMENCGEVSEFESEVYRKDGSTVWISESARAVFDAHDRVTYYQGFVEDITDRKLAETERINFTTELFRLNQAFSRFVPRQFLQILDKKSIVDVQLGDQVQQEMSILFSDIRNFTALSETMTPTDNFKFINSFLSRMEPAIIENQGFIDKYIGDGIMALFGGRGSNLDGANLPLDFVTRGSADDAVKAGIAMQKNLIEYNQHRFNSGYPPIKIGIGINTGTLMLGTVGGQNRMDGTVISDAVNLASRVEALTKYYGVSMLITHATFVDLNEPVFAMRPIDRVQVKGKSTFVMVYEVFEADLPEVRDRKLATASIFLTALHQYMSGKFGEAAQLFAECLQSNPLDSVAQIYLQRCENQQERSPVLSHGSDISHL